VLGELAPVVHPEIFSEAVSEIAKSHSSMMKRSDDAFFHGADCAAAHPST